MDEKELKEKYGRYSRLMANEDFTKTIAELDITFDLDGSVFKACNCPNASEYLFAKEGARSYRNTLMKLAELTEREIKHLEEETTNGEDNE